MSPLPASNMGSQNHGRLCELCTSCFYNPQKIIYRSKLPHHTNYVDLKRAADGGCYLCIRVCMGIDKRAHTQNASPVFTSMEYSIMRSQNRLQFSLDMGRPAISTFQWYDKSQYPEISYEDIPPTTKDPKCMEMARGWLHNCREHHECRKKGRLSALSTNPTRVLWVERSTKALLQARLHYPTTTEHLDYLTLSHVWGNQKFLTLTKANHDAFPRGIAISDLSKTFQDALHVTMELEFCFLWIDSLCIIQDDFEDWTIESKRMAQVYKNAVCNICAAATTSSASGFLPEKRTVPPLPPVVRLDETCSNELQLVSEVNPWGQSWEATLYQRAWVLQEQLLVSL
jgi:hypothetical protein